MASWWKSANASQLTRGLTSITGQLSNNLKDILSEASEETFDPQDELTRAKEQIENLEFRKQSLAEECAALKKQCDELLMQKQAAEIKSDMLLAESRRTIDEKDNELKRLRENANAMSWKTNNDPNNTWTDILEDDQPELSEYLKYQKMIRDLKDENLHLRDEMINLRKSIKSQQAEKSQFRREEDFLQLEQQLTKSREDYEEQIRQLKNRIEQLENHQSEELRQTIEVQKEDDVDKDLLAQELEQANEKLNWFNETFKEFQSKNEQLENDLKRAKFEENEKLSEELKIQVEENENLQRLLSEERERCDALANDNDSMCRLLEETRSKSIQLETQLKNEDLENRNFEEERLDLHQQIEQLKEQLQIKDRQIQNFENCAVTPGSPSVEDRTRSPSPDTFEHLLELEAQILRHEDEFRQLNSVYDRLVKLLPIEYSSTTDPDQLSLVDRFAHLCEQWSTYVDTLSITQEELESLKQLLIEKQDDLEKLQTDFDLTQTKLVELQQDSSSSSSFVVNRNENEEELEEILELHRFTPRAPSRQSMISSTPGEKQQLIAQNELLSSLLAEKDRELIELQQAEKTREDLMKNFERLKTNFQQVELEKETKQVELNEIRNVLDEKLRENSSLKKEKMNFIEKLAELERNRQEQQSMIQVSPRQSIEEKSSTPELPSTQAEKNDDQYEKLRLDYDQLVEFSKKQHEESLTYYNEYNRILALHNELNGKLSQIQIDYENIQSIIQQKNEAYLQCQNELTNYQNLFYHEKKKSEEIDLLRSTLNDREQKIQQFLTRETEFLLKQSEFERQIKLFEQTIFDYQNNEQIQIQSEQFQQQIENLKEKLNQSDEREKKLNGEIERLRNHLIRMEESYTNDLLVAEDREKSLRNHLAQLEDSNRAQHELIQQLNTTGEQSKQSLATELAALKHEFHKLETINQQLNQQLQYQMKCSQNLQNVLEQFKREREQHLNEHLRQYQDHLREQTSLVNRLTVENNDIRQRLSEYNEALAAAHRLNDQVEKKDLIINSLRTQIDHREEKIQQYELNLRDLQSTSGSRVEKQLVKNILLSYFHTPVDKRQEVVPLLGALVGFTQEEYRKAVDATTNNPNARTGWLTGLLGGNQSTRMRTQSETPSYDPNKSFTELLIQYVDQQSTGNPQFPAAKFNTDEYLHRHDQNVSSTGNLHSIRKPSVSSSANPFVNSTFPRPTSNVVLPTGNSSSSDGNSPQSTSSSTILKDLLKS